MKISKIDFLNISNKGFFFFFTFGIVFLFLGFSIPKNLEKKVKKNILKTFKVASYQLDLIDIPSNISPKIINKTNFSSISNNNSIIGYALIDKANSKTYDFDYLVILNPKLEIINIKILIYREEHGNEISSKRWLKQFFGLSSKNKAILQGNINGISGATISVRSMTTEMNNVLLDLNLLEKKNILPIN